MANFKKGLIAGLACVGLCLGSLALSACELESSGYNGNYTVTSGNVLGENESSKKGYVIDGGCVYYYDASGKKMRSCEIDGHTFDADGKMTSDDFVEIKGNTYYVKNGEIAYDYQVIEDSIYYFGNNGHMKKDEEYDGHIFDKDGKLNGNNTFVSINMDVYYLEENEVVRDFHIIEDYVYYFGNDGKMRTNTVVNGFVIGGSGIVFSEEGKEIVIDGTVYWIKGNKIQNESKLRGIVYESDNDLDMMNNPTLGNVLCTVEIHGETQTVYSDDEGVFNFGEFNAGVAKMTFTLSGYITTMTEVNLVGDLNLAVILDRDVSNTLSGRITIADTDMDYSNNAGLANATVTLERTANEDELQNNFYKATTTDATGSYTITDLTAGVYALTVECEGYIPVHQTVYVRYNETTIHNVAIEAISEEQTQDGYASGYVVDARTGYPVEGLSVNIRSGLGNFSGEPIMKVFTDFEGKYTTEALAPGNYTAEVVDERIIENEEERYGKGSISVKVMSNVTIANQNTTVSNSQNGFFSANSVRIVLTWGETPNDLDSHLYAKANDGQNYHIWYRDMNEYDNITNDRLANLDVDDTTSYGPETVTIYLVEDGIYDYYVHDFTNKSNSANTALCSSAAKVEIYIGESTEPYAVRYVPESFSGTSWHVFTYDSVTGAVTFSDAISHCRHEEIGDAWTDAGNF